MMDRNGKPFLPNQVLKIFYQVCRAVAHLQKQNPLIIHRDLKVSLQTTYLVFNHVHLIVQSRFCISGKFMVPCWLHSSILNERDVLS
jgi:serine/threonine protein kinase